MHVKSCWQQPFKICPLLFSRLIKHSRLWHIFSYYRLLTSSKQRLLSLRINSIHFKCQWIAVTRLKSSIWKRAWKNNHSLSPFYFFLHFIFFPWISLPDGFLLFFFFFFYLEYGICPPGLNQPNKALSPVNVSSQITEDCIAEGNSFSFMALTSDWFIWLGLLKCLATC